MTKSSENELELKDATLDAIRQHLERAVQIFTKKIDELEGGNDEDAKKVAEGLHSAMQVYLNERDRVEKRLEGQNLDGSEDGLDLCAAMAEIESRLARILERNGTQDIS